MTIESSEVPATLQPQGLQKVEGDEKKLETVRGAVLVVEDDPANRELLVEMLSMWGYEPIPVGSAEEADFAVRRKQLAAAIVDVFLPGRSGTTLMSKLRERFPDAVLIGISALGDSAIARKLKGLGANLFIAKPIAAEKLSEALQSKPQSWH